MAAIGASLVADVLLEQIDTSAPGKLGLLADKPLTNSTQNCEQTPSNFVSKTPWPPGQPVGPFGRLVQVTDLRASWKPEDLD